MNKLFNQIIDFIYTPRCACCTKYVMNDGGFCSECWNKLPFLKEPYCSLCSYQLKDLDYLDRPICGRCLAQTPEFDAAYALMHFNEKSKHLIYDFKYYDNPSYSKIFANLLVSRYRDDVCGADLLIPVPMHKHKRLGRLYNHSQLLAQDIASLLEKKINSDILLKVKNTQSQSVLGRQLRVRNLQGSIGVSNSDKVEGKNILLVDDVMTTCSTANICASKLKKAGAKGVKVLCIARRMLDNT